jgi:hypothetical protein
MDSYSNADDKKLLPEVTSSIIRLNSLKVDNDLNEKSLENEESAIYDDINSIFPDNSTAEIDIHDTKALKNLEYSKIFITDYNSNKLIAKFELEKKELIKSKSIEISYSLEDCRQRSAIGYYLFKYNFKSPSRSVVGLLITDDFVKLRRNEKIIKRIKFKSFHGILLGAVSSSFRNFKKSIEKVSGKLHKFYQCFSLVTEFRTYDFATTRDSDRIDILIYLSYMIALNSKCPTSIPFTKSDT